MQQQIADLYSSWNKEDDFSGVVMAMGPTGEVFSRASGHRNRAEGLPNELGTAFGIASGTKLFTGLAACKLIEEKKLNLKDLVHTVLPHSLGRIDRRVSVRHLLTHTSGIGDYIDEEAPDSYEAMDRLYSSYPVYLWNNLEYYLPMYRDLAPKFAPGERFGYSNAGFALLGLVVEQAAGMPFHQYVTERIITPCGLSHTGFYRMDRLPANTAYGYLKDEATGQWHSNIFCMPAVGGADGGLFTCAADLDRLWRALFAGRILGEEMLRQFLTPQVQTKGMNGLVHYGLGVYQYRHDNQVSYHAVGGDFGVDFFTATFPSNGLTVSALGNTEKNTYPLLRALCEAFA